MTSHTISGALTLPDDTSPLIGTWSISLATLEGTARDVDGSVRAGIKPVDTDPATGQASVSLPDSGTDDAYLISFRSKAGKNRVELGPYQVTLSANMTWSQVINQPLLAPLPEGALPAYLDQLRLNAAYGAGSDLWLKLIAQEFGFSWSGALVVDAATGLVTSANVKWPDGNSGVFTGTVDSSYYTGFTVTWVNGGTTKTVTVTGISLDTSSGLPLGPTGLAVA